MQPMQIIMPTGTDNQSPFHYEDRLSRCIVFRHVKQVLPYNGNHYTSEARFNMKGNPVAPFTNIV